MNRPGGQPLLGCGERRRPGVGAHQPRRRSGATDDAPRARRSRYPVPSSTDEAQAAPHLRGPRSPRRVGGLRHRGGFRPQCWRLPGKRGTGGEARASLDGAVRGVAVKAVQPGEAGAEHTRTLLVSESRGGTRRFPGGENWNGRTDPGKTVWECAADDVDRAETQLLDAMAAGDDAEVAEAADHLASVQRRSGTPLQADGRGRAAGWLTLQAGSSPAVGVVELAARSGTVMTPCRCVRALAHSLVAGGAFAVSARSRSMLCAAFASSVASSRISRSRLSRSTTPPRSLLRRTRRSMDWARTRAVRIAASRSSQEGSSSPAVFAPVPSTVMRPPGHSDAAAYEVGGPAGSWDSDPAPRSPCRRPEGRRCFGTPALPDAAVVDARHLVLVFHVDHSLSLLGGSIPGQLTKYSDTEDHAPYRAACLKLATLRHYREQHQDLEGTGDSMEGRSRITSTLEGMCRRHGARNVPHGAHRVTADATYQTDDTSLIYCTSRAGNRASRHKQWRTESRIRDVPEARAASRSRIRETAR